MMRITCLLISISCLICCNSSENKTAGSDQITAENTSSDIKYAEGFQVTYTDNAKWVEVPKPYQGAKQGFSYLLVQKGQQIPPHDKNVQVIEVPINTIVCTSTTHIPLLDYLGETSSLTGFPTTDYISSKKTRARIDSGHVTDLGVDNEMNLELILSLNPDMVMAYTMNNDFGQFRQIQNADIPVVINAEYLESHPLGRAEWIKFMGLFYNKEKEADSIFRYIENQYLSLQKKAMGVKKKPSVLSGVVYGDTWYMPGGNNYASKILNDAAGNYLWSEDSTSGFLELSFEAVYDQAHDADFWIGVGSYKSLKAMRSSDNRYADFEAFKQKNVFTYDARKGAKGGSEFLELGYLRPDLILEDLMKILHPEVMDDQELFFHARLPKTTENTE